jgi:hypothetical protein
MPRLGKGILPRNDVKYPEHEPASELENPISLSQGGMDICPLRREIVFPKAQYRNTICKLARFFFLID